MRIASERELRLGWFGTAAMITFAGLVLIGDGILYLIYHSLPFIVIGVFSFLIGLALIAWSLKPTATQPHDTSDRRADNPPR